MVAKYLPPAHLSSHDPFLKLQINLTLNLQHFDTNCVQVSLQVHVFFSYKPKLIFYVFPLRILKAKGFVKSSISEIAEIEIHSILVMKIIKFMTLTKSI